MPRRPPLDVEADWTALPTSEQDGQPMLHDFSQPQYQISPDQHLPNHSMNPAFLQQQGMQAEDISVLRAQNAQQEHMIQALRSQLDELSKRMNSAAQSSASSASPVSLPITSNSVRTAASSGEFRFPKSAKNTQQAAENSTTLQEQHNVVSPDASISSASVLPNTNMFPTKGNVCIEKWFLAREPIRNVVYTLCETWTDFLGPCRLVLESAASSSASSLSVQLFTNSLSFVPSHVQARFFFKPNVVPKLAKKQSSEQVTSPVLGKQTMEGSENPAEMALQSMLSGNDSEVFDPDTLQDTVQHVGRKSKPADDAPITRKEMYDLESDANGARDGLLEVENIEKNSNPFWSVIELPLVRDNQNLHRFNGLLTIPRNSIPQFTAVLRLF